MTLAVPQEQLDEFLQLAAHMDVEATLLGRYTDSGVLHVTYGDKVVTHLDMEFLHKGLPTYELPAEWSAPSQPDMQIPAHIDHNDLIVRMLGRLNICSKEYLVRQYDHEVQGGSVVKPMVGVKADGPSDAGVLRPDLESNAGLVLSHGICPKFSDLDTYWMTANAIDEGVRNAVAVGGDPEHMAGVDNFCWCDPVQSEKTPDGAYKMAQLVRSCMALSDFCRAYNVPCVSGKDSMKNDYTGGGEKISIPPTLLFSVMGVMPDVNRAVTSDFKKAGNRIYLLGFTKREMGASEFADELKLVGGNVPMVNAAAALASYKALHKAVTAGLVAACHDLSDGGLAIAAAEMCIGGRLGAEINLKAVPCDGSLSDAEILYSESASRLLVEVTEEYAAAFEAAFTDCPVKPAHIGRVADSGFMNITDVLSVSVDTMTAAFKKTLDW